MDAALQRRLHEELGVKCPLTFLYRFEYRAAYRDVGAEHEVCSVYSGTYDGPLRVNETEIDDVRFVAPRDLEREVSDDPDSFTPWFKMELKRIFEDFAGPGRR